MLNDFDITGKTVLITGAGRGIGKGIALTMAEDGADVAVTSLGRENAENVAAMVTAIGRRGFGWAADGTKVAEMQAVREKTLAAFGHLDILVNCLGDSIAGDVTPLPGAERPTLDETSWHKVIDINLTQAFIGCHVFGPDLIARGQAASVINISSFAAIRAGAHMVAYASAKAGLTRFTESLALEWAPSKVRVNAIAPGFFPDAYAMSASDWEEMASAGNSRVPLGRIGHPREVGQLAVFLTSNAASYITGQIICIDGGLTVA